MKSKKILSFVLLLFSFQTFACTIFSAKDKKGQVWTGNNEDNLFTFNSLVNIVPSTPNSFGYIYFTYNDSREGKQGGVNEAGLFFDFNAVPYTKRTDSDKKPTYPGENLKMFEHIMEHLTTVQEVMDLYKKYKVFGVEYGQLHLADKFGNLGIIVADSMWITKNNYLASTNYNLCHADHDGDDCFRMPIAERLLKNNEPSFELFTQICDSTHQFYSSGASTIYSNIHNLTTGEIWFYFGLDFKTVHKTTLQELLKQGKSSFYVCDLFEDQTLVKAYRAAQNKEYDRSIVLINAIKDSTERANMLLLLVTGLIDMGGDFDSYPIFEAYFNSKKPELKDYWVNSSVLYFIGRKEEALSSIEDGLKLDPKDYQLLNLKLQLEGKFFSEANYRIELKGFQDAKYVLLDGISYYKLDYFLVKKGDSWVAAYPLPPDEYLFRFIVDGKVVIVSQFEKFTLNGIEYNRVVIKKSFFRHIITRIFKYKFKIK